MTKRGNVFLIIIGILAIIFTVAIYFIRGTVEEKTLTERSHRAIHAQCLAEAALERAMNILSKDLNDPAKMKDPTTLANRLRLPLQVAGGSTFGGLGTALGNDQPLDIAPVQMAITLDKAQLQGTDTDFDEMVDFMVGQKGMTYDMKVSLTLDKALRPVPGPKSGGDAYKVPGVDIPYSIHSGVRDFLDNKGYTALKLAMPEDARWLALNISTGLPIPGLDQADLMDLLYAVFPESWRTEMDKWVTFDGLLKQVMPSLYPYEIKLAKDIFPPLADKLGGVAPPAFAETTCVEKVGYLRIEAEGSITYGDRKTTTKRVMATKEFKCADIEPVAPCYSLFISNLHDDKLVFNDAGGTLMVQNFPNFLDSSSGETRCFPGLIRANGTKATMVNVSFYGNPMNGDIFNFARVAEVPLIADVKVADLVNGNGFTLYGRESHNQTTTPVPSEVKGLRSTVDNSLNAAEASVNKFTASVEKRLNPNPPAAPAGATKTSTFKQIYGALGKYLNFVPKIGGCTIFEPALHLVPLPGPLAALDPFKKWDWPYSAGPLSIFGVGIPVPMPAFGSTVTHFFGPAAVYPTMTREIEGAVGMRYQQWHCTIIGFPMGPFPLGKQIPLTGIINLPPIPIPLVHTHEKGGKYEYTFYTMKSTENENAEPDGQVTIYDPKNAENSPPNLYSVEQYAKKATYFYTKADDFWKDAASRMATINGKSCYRLNGVVFIADDVTLPPVGSDTFFIHGRGSIVVGGNVVLRGHVEDPYDDTEEVTAGTPRTVFSLIARQGGIIINDTALSDPLRFEGCLYSDKGMAAYGDKSIHIRGNWVTNTFNKASAQGDIKITHIGYKTRSSLNSVHPTQGKYDPERYHLTMMPGWEAWRVQ